MQKCVATDIFSRLTAICEFQLHAALYVCDESVLRTEWSLWSELLTLHVLILFPVSPQLVACENKESAATGRACLLIGDTSIRLKFRSPMNAD